MLKNGVFEKLRCARFDGVHSSASFTGVFDLGGVVMPELRVLQLPYNDAFMSHSKDSHFDESFSRLMAPSLRYLHFPQAQTLLFIESVRRQLALNPDVPDDVVLCTTYKMTI